jgi:hypothetical protein
MNSRKKKKKKGVLLLEFKTAKTILRKEGRSLSVWRRHTILLDSVMDEGDDARRNIIRDIDGFRICLLGHHGAFLQVSGEKPIGIACKPLLSQPPLQVFRPHPHPIQNPPPHRYDCNGHKDEDLSY